MTYRSLKATVIDDDAKTPAPMKATLLDDDAFRLLALPYGGPIPYPGAPRGADVDRQWFSEQTAWGDVPKTVPVNWHHGQDPWSHLPPGGADPRELVGKASDLTFDDDGGWVTVWLDAGRKRTRLIKALADAAKDDPEVDIYGSAEGIPGSGRVRRGDSVVPWRRKLPGEIAQWHYSGQTLSTSPQNTYSILTPLKATLDDLASDELEPTAAFFDDLATFLDSLAPSPGMGKAGRVLAARNEARLLEAREHIDLAYFDPKRRRAALSALDEVLRELEQYIQSE